MPPPTGADRDGERPLQADHGGAERHQEQQGRLEQSVFQVGGKKPVIFVGVQALQRPTIKGLTTKGS